MRKQIISFQRSFQMWAFSVGHLQLLMRSTKVPGFPTRIDILFKNVDVIQLPTKFDGLMISEDSEKKIKELYPWIDSRTIEGQKLFCVRGSNFMGHVIAGAVAWHEDELEYHDPSHFSIVPEL